MQTVLLILLCLGVGGLLWYLDAIRQLLLRPDPEVPSLDPVIELLEDIRRAAEVPPPAPEYSRFEALLVPELAGINRGLAAQSESTAEFLAKLSAKTFTCYYCSRSFDMDKLERIGTYDYCQQHGWQRQARMNKAEAA